MWPVGVVVWRTWFWGAPEEIILTHLYLLNSHQALGQTLGKKVNGPQLRCLRACWQGVQNPGQDAHPSCLEGERKRDSTMAHRVIPCPVPAGAPLSQSC